MPNAKFEYQVSPGGKIPAILQMPNSPQATFQFVNGAGVYNLLLVITDADGSKTTMPFLLNYAPSTSTSGSGSNPCGRSDPQLDVLHPVDKAARCGWSSMTGGFALLQHVPLGILQPLRRFVRPSPD